MVCQKLPSLGIVANLVEYPAVAKGSARIRLQVMASHSTENIDLLVEGLSKAVAAAKPLYQRYCEQLSSGPAPALRASA
jgi:hypothetical protein